MPGAATNGFQNSFDGGNNIDVNGGTFTLGSSAVISAGGTLDVTGGTANVNGDITGATNIDVSGGTLTIGAAKAIIAEVLKPAAERDVALCEQWVARCYASEDFAEGQRAFAEKRKARFTGR